MLYKYERLQYQIAMQKNKNISDRDYLRFILNIATADLASVYLKFGSSPHGLPGWQVDKNRETYGYNRIFQKNKMPWYVFLFTAIRNPFNIVLFILAVVALLTKDYTGTIIIVVMVLLSVGIKFRQELKSARTEEALKKMVSTRVSVFRLEKEDLPTQLPAEIPLEELVPGDVVHLSAGDMVPADVRIISAKTLFVNESTLTGESLPVEKKELFSPEKTTNRNETDFENICFLGSNIVTGSAMAIVIATGKETYLGSMAGMIATIHPPTPFDIGITKISWLLIRLMLIISPAVFLINGFTKGNWIEALLFGLSVAVGLTPEMLPVVVTTNLAKGAVRMSKKKVIVRNLNSIQDIGAMNILCTDKTGTLTENRIVLIKHLNSDGEQSNAVLELAFLNSYFQSGLRNLMDEAILGNHDLQNEDRLKADNKKIDEIPFDFERRRMSVVIEHQNKEHLLICKGALEEVLSQCKYHLHDDQVLPLDDSGLSAVRQLSDSLNEDGMRVVLVAHKVIPLDHGPSYEVSDETELILDGLVTFLDPPKLSASHALRQLRENNVCVKVLTGDNDVIARKVCLEVGFTDFKVVTGSYLNTLDEEAFRKVIIENTVFAKLTPLQKDRIVKTLQKEKNVVGYMGDGINDAAALNSADIGISVDHAVDIARENADFILLEQDLTILNAGVEEGRKIYANTIKYIKCTASSNFGNIFSLIGASALFPFLPMLPLQILILNLIYDLSQTALPWDNVDRDFLKTPHSWEVNDITRFILLIGPLSSVFDYCTFGVMYFVFHTTTAASQGLFQTGWFIESLFSQTIVIQMLRTRKLPFIQSMASKRVLLTSGILLLVGLWMPYSWLGDNIGMQPLPLSYYGWLIVILFAYCLLVQGVKRWYIRRFGRWL